MSLNESTDAKKGLREKSFNMVPAGFRVVFLKDAEAEIEKVRAEVAKLRGCINQMKSALEGIAGGASFETESLALPMVIASGKLATQVLAEVEKDLK